MRPIVRKLLRSPQVLYRRRWGWLLGHRFLLPLIELREVTRPGTAAP